MALWLNLHANRDILGTLEVRRLQDLPIASSAIDDSRNDYEVKLDGYILGRVTHRYGDGPWVLLNLATALVVFTRRKDEPNAPAASGSIDSNSICDYGLLISENPIVE
jgi:hypothetical protein